MLPPGHNAVSLPQTSHLSPPALDKQSTVNNKHVYYVSVIIVSYHKTNQRRSRQTQTEKYSLFPLIGVLTAQSAALLQQHQIRSAVVFASGASHAGPSRQPACEGVIFQNAKTANRMSDVKVFIAE